MSKWSDAMSTGMVVSAAASDEAARAGSPEMDIDHLLVALAMSGGPAGAILRRHGVSLDSVRAAITAVRDRELSTLGITATETGPMPQRPLGDVNLDWSRRAQEVLSGTGGEYDGTGLLRSLLAEPSGTIAQILRELNVDPDAVRADIDSAKTQGLGTDVRYEHRGRHLPTAAEGFAPAPVEQVWELVSDPLRLPEWDSAVQAISPAGPGKWIGRQDRRKLRGGIVEGHQQMQIRVLASEADTHRVIYERTWPSRRRSGDHRVTVELEPVKDGTRVIVHSSVRLASGVRRLLQVFFTPLGRFMISAQAAHLASGITRRFR
ncbi:SRPBCC family protein [Blastococcus sp. Marseille-P5729]|uniref:SRPBCC family protein n=1 Tax=Blastococcus sp. Marseille-P5729 TaxID=2086582 RepID=UPI000D10704E|nr:Clp protease N-terminal domain-containing protein [Blastococcus sp. Marseille-P5729]